MAKDPVVPLPPPPGELHDVLLVDDQWIIVVAPLAMEASSAQTVTVGAEPPASAVPSLHPASSSRPSHSGGKATSGAMRIAPMLDEHSLLWDIHFSSKICT